MKNKYIVFDLDDTLVSEIDYLKSAFREIAEKFQEEDEFPKMIRFYQNNENVFSYLSSKYGVSIENLLNQYRNHFPKLNLNKGALELLNFCKENNYKLGLITDGRSVTQRNKIRATDLENYFDRIIISEEYGSAKPDERNYKIFMDDRCETEFFYIADNITKDFITPNKLGWTTIMLKDNGQNIHNQDLFLPAPFHPNYTVDNLSEIKKYLF